MVNFTIFAVTIFHWNYCMGGQR